MVGVAFEPPAKQHWLRSSRAQMCHMHVFVPDGYAMLQIICLPGRLRPDFDISLSSDSLVLACGDTLLPLLILLFSHLAQRSWESYIDGNEQ